MNNKDKSEKYFILSAILGGCILISYLVFVIVKNSTQDTAFATICFAIVAVALCGGAYHIFNKLYNLVPKSERERIKAEKLAEEARKKQLAEVQSHEVSRPEPQQPQIVVQNTIVNQNAILNEVNTEVVNNVVNEINNENTNIVEANANAQANVETLAPTDVKAESPIINVTPPPVTVEPPVVNIEIPKPTPTTPFATIQEVDTTIGDDSYKASIAAHEQARKKRESDKVKAIMEYLKIAMPPFMPQDQLEKLCQEVLEWIKDPDYLPSEGVHVYQEFSTLDARHLICNISERLSKNYTGHNRSWFIKKLFAETCRQLEEPAIYKNIKERPNQGHIKYDQPKNGDIAFHYELLENN